MLYWTREIQIPSIIKNTQRRITMIMISDPVISRHMKKSSRISFNQCGVEYCSPGHSYGPRVRWYCIIHFILEGQGRLIIHKQQYDVHAGDAFLIPANAEGYYAADYERPWKYFWLSFSGTEAENYCSLIFGKEVFVKKLRIWTPYGNR